MSGRNRSVGCEICRDRDVLARAARLQSIGLGAVALATRGLSEASLQTCWGKSIPSRVPQTLHLSTMFRNSGTKQASQTSLREQEAVTTPAERN